MLSIQEINLLQSHNLELRQQNLSLQIENREFRKQIEKIQRNNLVKTINELQRKLRVEQCRNTNLINRYKLKGKDKKNDNKRN